MRPTQLARSLLRGRTSKPMSQIAIVDGLGIFDPVYDLLQALFEGLAMQHEVL